jgi:hypothetical protein
MSKMSTTTKLERENLEAHVDLCAERYKQLDYRLSVIETKVGHISEAISSGNKNMSKVIIGTGGTVIAAVFTAIVTILMKF